MVTRKPILLADDDFEDRMIISGAFKEIGNDDVVHYVEDGEKVIEYLDSIQNDELLPSLIVLDLNMPRLSGLETLRIVKQVDKVKNIPVIMFSTSINEHEMNECLKLGAVSYITKPSRYLDSISIAKRFSEFI